MGLIDVSYANYSPDDLTELALRVALFGESNPLGDMAFMAELDNPIPAIAQIGLDEDSFAGAAEVLLVESLVGSGRAGRVTALQIGPARSGHLLRLGWEAPRRFSNVDARTAADRRQAAHLTASTGKPQTHTATPPDKRSPASAPPTSGGGRRGGLATG